MKVKTTTALKSLYKIALEPFESLTWRLLFALYDNFLEMLEKYDIVFLKCILTDNMD